MTSLPNLSYLKAFLRSIIFASVLDLCVFLSSILRFRDVFFQLSHFLPNTVGDCLKYFAMQFYALLYHYIKENVSFKTFKRRSAVVSFHVMRIRKDFLNEELYSESLGK